MNTTILCSFDDVDMAELAAGRLREKIPGLFDLEISRPFYGEPEGHEDFVPFAAGFSGLGAAGLGGTTMGMNGPALMPTSFAAAPGAWGEDSSGEQGRASDYIPRSVTLRFTCNAAQRARAEAQLINLGASKIRAHQELPPS